MGVFVTQGIGQYRRFVGRLPTSTRGKLTLRVLIFTKTFTSGRGVDVLFTLTRGRVYSILTRTTFTTTFTLGFGLIGDRFGRHISGVVKHVTHVLFDVSRLHTPGGFFTRFAVRGHAGRM